MHVRVHVHTHIHTRKHRASAAAAVHGDDGDLHHSNVSEFWGRVTSLTATSAPIWSSSWCQRGKTETLEIFTDTYWSEEETVSFELNTEDWDHFYISYFTHISCFKIPELRHKLFYRDGNRKHKLLWHANLLAAVSTRVSFHTCKNANECG